MKELVDKKLTDEAMEKVLHENFLLKQILLNIKTHIEDVLKLEDLNWEEKLNEDSEEQKEV